MNLKTAEQVSLNRFIRVNENSFALVFNAVFFFCPKPMFTRDHNMKIYTNSGIRIVMPRLHLLGPSYDLFVYDFFGILGGISYGVCGYIAYDHLTISIGDKLEQNLQRPFRYRTTTTRLSCNHRVIFTTSLYKSHNTRTMTLRKSQGAGTLTAIVVLLCEWN